jgi:hypothetical protein
LGCSHPRGNQLPYFLFVSFHMHRFVSGFAYLCHLKWFGFVVKYLRKKRCNSLCLSALTIWALTRREAKTSGRVQRRVLRRALVEHPSPRSRSPKPSFEARGSRVEHESSDLGIHRLGNHRKTPGSSEATKEGAIAGRPGRARCGRYGGCPDRRCTICY